MDQPCEAGLGGMFITGTLDRNSLARLEWLELEPGPLACRVVASGWHTHTHTHLDKNHSKILFCHPLTQIQWAQSLSRKEVK